METATYRHLTYETNNTAGRVFSIHGGVTWIYTGTKTSLSSLSYNICQNHLQMACTLTRKTNKQTTIELLGENKLEHLQDLRTVKDLK